MNAVRFDGRAAVGEIFDGVGLVAASEANGITFKGKRVLRPSQTLGWRTPAQALRAVA
ncbi:MAG: hypothetical protein AAGD35_04720 [Actinomycetota bacterium]